jgi:hypothetical protein
MAADERWINLYLYGCTVFSCGSELARDGFEGDAFFQTVRVIVHLHREQACSYINS